MEGDQLVIIGRICITQRLLIITNIKMRKLDGRGDGRNKWICYLLVEKAGVRIGQSSRFKVRELFDE